MKKDYIINAIENELGAEYSAEFVSVPKNNVMREGISIRKVADNIAVNVYFNEDDSDDEIVAHVLNVFNSNPRPEFVYGDLSWIMDWEQAKDKVIPCFYNKTKSVFGNQFVTRDYVSDIGICFKLIVGMNEGGMGSIRIEKSLFKNWNITEDKLFEQAKENLNKEIVIKDMQELLFMMMGKAPDRTVEPGIMSVISNTSMVNGAVATIMLPDLVAKGELENHDYYVIPSSIHECILVDPTMIAKEDLNMMIQDVNREVVAVEDFLSDYALKYDAESKTVIAA